MLRSKTLTLFLLGLTWSIGCFQATDAVRGRASSIRGRWLQESTDSEEEIPSADAESSEEESAPKTAKGVKKRSIGPEARQCKTKENKDKVEFECKSVTTEGNSQVKDTLHFKIGATKGDHLKISVEYESKWESSTPDETESASADEGETETTSADEGETETTSADEGESSPASETMPTNETEPASGRALQTDSETDSETKTKYTLVYDRLIEYRKKGSASDNHYEWGVDEVVAEYPMDKWDQLSPVQVNGDLLTFSAKAGMATFNFTISQSDATDISTNKMKIDFLLENYPWAETNDTYIALISHIETKRKTRTGRAETRSDRVSDVMIDFDDAVQTIGFVPFGEYTWASTAEATVSVTPVDDDVNGTEVMIERSANNTGDDGFGSFAEDDMSGNFTAAGTTGNVTTPRTATISVVASSSNRTDPRPGPHDDQVTFQEIAFSFVGAGKGAERIYWDPEAGIGYSSSPARMVGSFVLLASTIVVTLLL